MVSEMTDKLITPGHYETADEYHEKRLSKVSILCSQCRDHNLKLMDANDYMANVNT